MLNVLHCKKLRLAVEDAIADVPSPLSKLDHRWVAGKTNLYYCIMWHTLYLTGMSCVLSLYSYINALFGIHVEDITTLMISGSNCIVYMLAYMYTSIDTF